MSSLETKEGASAPRPMIPEGQHLGLLFQIIDLGTQMESFNGQEAKPLHKIQLGFEIPKFTHVFDEKKGPQPLSVFQEYTFSLNTKANFRKMMDSWIGKPVKELNYEILTKLLGRPGMVMIEHGVSRKDPSVKYNNIAFKGLAVSKRLPDVAFPAKTMNPLFFFELGHFSWEQFGQINEYLQKKIRQSLEFKQIIKTNPEPVKKEDGQGSEHKMDEGGAGVAMSNSIEEEDPFA